MTRKLMRQIIQIAVLFGALSVVLSAQGVDAGKHTFASNCAGCHGLDAKGSERGPDIATRRAIQKLPDTSLAAIIRNGKAGTGMPPFHSLGEPRIQAVLKYLRTLQGQGSASPLPGDPNAGRVLFAGTPACSNCHTTNGERGFIASDLSSYASSKTADEIRESITNPNKNLDPRKRTVVAKTSDGATLTGVARNEDNFSLQLQTLDGAFHLLNKSELQSLEHQPTSLMPADYASRLTRQQLDDLVSYLMSTAQIHPTKNPEQE
jgi:putative heme-binding domain-containing protein